MHGRIPQPRDGRAMQRGAIPFVAGEAVARKFCVQLSHPFIAGGLGEDGGGREAQGFLVAVVTLSTKFPLKTKNPHRGNPVRVFVVVVPQPFTHTLRPIYHA